MTPQIFVGLFSEGSTDDRFLLPIIERTFINIADTECKGQIDIICIKDGIEVDKKGKGFVEQVTLAAQKAWEEGITVLCIQTDADSKNLQATYTNKITPLLQTVTSWDKTMYCHLHLFL
ncbi:MAG: hypothetical protein JNM36_06900 [Chitinophagales bacterium]|nr:hypothetical protein [Chitinophagales bacterium]